MYDLRQIECFIAVAEELHMGRAAARLHITKPPLSRQIALLEHDLQFALFLRANRSLTLTHAGRVFYEEAKQLISVATNATENAKRVARGEAGLLRIGFTAGSSYAFLPKLLAHTDRHIREVEVVLHEMMSRDQITALHTNAIDVGFLRPIFSDRSLRSLLVTSEPLVLALPKGHRLCKGRLPNISDLEGERFITFSPDDGTYFHSLVERTLTNASVHVDTVQRVGQIHSILALVGAGQGIALVPESAKTMGFQNITTRKIDTEPVLAELAMAWKVTNQNPALKRFVESISRERIPADVNGVELRKTVKF
jgi:DNA-binding transcriptional LysR family regulator